MAKSTGLQCASFNCYSCSYNFIDHVRVPTKISFFCFPKNSQKGMLCVIWSNEERLKMVLESANPSIVWEAFSPWKKLQTSWRYSEKTDSVNQTSFTPLEQLYLHWKTSKRASEAISKEESKGSRLQWATVWCATRGFIWNWWQYSAWWFTSRFWKKKPRVLMTLIIL